ncbi:MAG TPA: envelope integrity protein Cei [Pseudonocardia sp.]|jgi:hypothetical protein
MAGPIRRVYQRRSARPAITLAVALVLVVAATWIVVLGNAPKGPAGADCPTSTVAAQGSVQDTTALDSVAPAPPNTVRIRVLNGGGQRGQANLVASQLGELGFTEAADPVNDPLYPEGNLSCRGNIRYGGPGAAAARTMSLVLPCVSLVKDDRADDTIDVAVGTLFGDVNPSKAARDALDQLDGPGGSGGVGPGADPELVTAAREVPC